MTVPSPAEFSQWISDANAEVEVPYPLPRLQDLTKEIAVEYLLASRRRRTERINELCERPLIEWLDSQRSFVRANEILAGRRRKKKVPVQEPIEERIRKLVDTEHERATTKDEGLFDYFRSSIERRGSINMSVYWIYGFVGALAEYFPNKRSEELIDAFRNIAPAAARLQTALVEYLAHVNVIDSMKLAAVSPMRNNYLNKVAQRGVAIHDVRLSPLRRIDDRSSERLFVYRMLWLNVRHYRSAKTESIVELMGMEGFRHQYESRTVERLCRDFTDSYRENRARFLSGHE